MVHSRDPPDRLDERLPGIPLGGQDAPAFPGQSIEAPPALARLLHPAPPDPAPLLQPVEEGIERGNVEAEAAPRAGLDQLADLVAVPGPALDQRQDQQLRRAF